MFTATLLHIMSIFYQESQIVFISTLIYSIIKMKDVSVSVITIFFYIKIVSHVTEMTTHNAHNILFKPFHLNLVRKVFLIFHIMKFKYMFY